MLRSVLALVVGALAGFGAGYAMHKPPPPPPPVSLAVPGTGPVVATWKGGQMTADQLTARLVETLKQAGINSADPARRGAFAADILRNEVLSEEAWGKGLLQDPTTAGQVKTVLARRLIEKEFDENESRRAVSNEDLTKYYDEHKSEFVRPERVAVAEVFVAVPEGNKMARATARQKLEKLRKTLLATPPKDEKAFLDAAKGVVSSGSEDKAEDLGALSKQEMEAKLGPEFTQTAWLLVKLGEISRVIETPKGFHLAWLRTREGAADVTAEQARETIRSRLWYARRSEEIDRYIKETEASLQFKVNQEALDKALAAFGN